MPFLTGILEKKINYSDKFIIKKSLHLTKECRLHKFSRVLYREFSDF